MGFLTLLCGVYRCACKIAFVAGLSQSLHGGSSLRGIIRKLWRSLKPWQRRTRRNSPQTSRFNSLLSISTLNIVLYHFMNDTMSHLYHECLFQTLHEDETDSPTASLLDLFRTPNMRKHTFILMFNWWDSHEITDVLAKRDAKLLGDIKSSCFYYRFTSAVVYQGLIMRVGIAGGDVYIDFLLSGLAEFPATFFILFSIDRIGRRLPFATANILAGASCLIAAFIPDSK